MLLNVRQTFLSICNKNIVSVYLLFNAVLDTGATSVVNYHIMSRQDTQ